MTGGSDRTRRSVLKQLEDGSPRAATGGDGPAGERHAVGLTPEADPAAIEALEAGRVATTVDLGHVGTVVAGEFSAATRRRLEADDRVRYVEPDRPPAGFEADDGTALAQRDVGRVAARPAVDGDRGVVSTWDGTLVAYRHVRP